MHPWIHTSLRRFTHILHQSCMRTLVTTWTSWILITYSTTIYIYIYILCSSLFNLQRGRASFDDAWPRFHWEVHSAMGRVGTVVLSIGWLRGCDPTGRIQPPMQRHFSMYLRHRVTSCDWDQPCRCIDACACALQLVSWCLRVFNT